MKLPKLAAQYSIGPAIGEYAALAPHVDGPALVPMIGVAQMLDLNNLTIEDAIKQRNTSQCGATQKTCWGDPARNKAYWYICCESTETCGYDNTGLPTCLPAG